MTPRPWPYAVVVALVVGLHLIVSPYGEPWKNHDETRHVMTGVFVRDALIEWRQSLADPAGYAERYYAKRPALGLLVWPPFFYLVEGLVMAPLGPGYAVARLTLLLFLLLGCRELVTLFRRTLPEPFPLPAFALVLVSPMVVEYSRFVMLELPTLALLLAAVNRFEDYLTTPRRRSAIWACVFAALAALTRFDGVLVGVYFVIRLATLRKWAVLADRPVAIGVMIAVVMTAPYYAMTYYYYSAGLSGAAVTGTGADRTGFLTAENLWLYPAFTFDLVGRFLPVAALIGVAVTRRRLAGPAGPLTTLWLATYLFFVPLAEPEARHAIYWVPALCRFAALGLAWVRDNRGESAAAVATFLLVFATGYQAAWEPGDTVNGYAAAADYCLTERETDRPVLYDGSLTGGFVYQVALRDPARTVTVLRGDKLLYAVLSDPRGGYREFATTPEEVHARLHSADPEWVVVESRELFGQGTPAARQLQQTLRTRPNHYRLTATIRLDSNHGEFRECSLLIYKKLVRNPAPEDGRPLPVLGLGREIGG